MNLANAIISSLSDELRKPPYRGNPNPLAGHCYVASEAFFHLAGGQERFTPMVTRVPGGTHWFLKDKETGEIVDLTAGQFDFAVDYESARGTGFLTKSPSRRAQEVIRRAVGL